MREVTPFDVAFRQVVGEWLLEGFMRYPGSWLATYVSGSHQTCIDYVFAEDGVVTDLAVEATHITVHRAITANLHVAFGSSRGPDGLVVRQGNLRIPNVKIPLTRNLLVQSAALLVSNMPDWTVSDLYRRILACLNVFGSRSTPDRVQDRNRQGWLAFLNDEEADALVAAESDMLAAKQDMEIAPGTNADSRYQTVMMDWRRLNVDLKAVVTARLQKKHCVAIGDNSACWKLLKDLRNPAVTVPISPRVLFEHFNSLYHDQLEPLIPTVELSPSDIVSVSDDLQLEDSFTMAELDEALNALNLQAATGPDGISGRLIKTLFNETDTKEVLLLLMNKCFVDGILPADWQESHITILFKGKGDVKDPSNYRGINVLNALFKVYERLVYERLSKWAVVNNLLGAEQYGFRAGRSTQEPIFIVQTLVALSTAYLCIPLYAVFVDLTKAFPSISRRVLLQRLIDLGLPVRMIKAIASMFSINVGALKIGGLLTMHFFITKGVREGGVLSPLLFALVLSILWEKMSISNLVDGAKKLLFGMSSRFIMAYAECR